MRSEEQRQIFDELRERVHEELAGIAAPSDTLDRLRARARDGGQAAGGRRRAVRDGHDRGPLSRAPGWVALAGAIAVALLIAAGAVLLVSHRAPSTGRAAGHRGDTLHHLRPGFFKHPTMADLKYTGRAYDAVYRRDPACSPVRWATTWTTVSYGAPNQAMLSVLPVLSRPATPADELPPSLRRGRRLVLDPSTGGVYVRYVRLARVHDGVSFYIVPVARIGPITPARTVIDRCYHEEMSALRAELPRIPARLRSATLLNGDAAFASYRRAPRAVGSPEGAGLLTAERGLYGESGLYESAAMIRKIGILSEFNGSFYGLVPAGVATVTLAFPAREVGSEHLPAIRVTGDVVNSVFDIHIPHAGTIQNWPSTMTWRAASGHLIRTVSPALTRP